MLSSFIDDFLRDNPLSNNIEENEIKYRGKKIDELNIDDMVSAINDFSNSPKIRMNCLKRIALEFPEKMNEILEGFKNSYIFTGSDGFEKILEFIVLECPNISSITKYKITIALMEVAEKIIKKETQDEIEDIKEFNLIRLKNAGDILEKCCDTEYDEFPSPCKLEIIFKFLKHDYFFDYFIKYIKKFISKKNSTSDYKYKSLLSIETKSQELKKINNILWKRSFIKKDKIEDEIEDEDEYSIEEDGYFIKEDFLKYRQGIDNIIINMFIYFLRQEDINLNYRILAAQNILNKNYISEKDRKVSQDVLLQFISDDTIKDQQMADIADVLLQYGDEEVKMNAREIIRKLGFKGAKGNTIFDNAQNVHTIEIEESGIEILEHLTKLPIYKIENNLEVDYTYVYKDIERSMTSVDFFLEEEQRDSVIISLNRICLDRALYSKMSCTLISILLRVWSYIQNHKYKDELYKRLLQELIDMSGWCSSGFAYRILNTLSGFGEFDLKISWSDQITANFSGRFAACINKISDTELKEDIITGFTATMEENPEMRRKFLNFFMKTMPYIREEMWLEFKEYIDDSDFDLSFRKAVAKVIEGITLESGIKNAIFKQKKKEEKKLIINDAKRKTQWE